jgi:hypothetical protein
LLREKEPFDEKEKLLRNTVAQFSRLPLRYCEERSGDAIFVEGMTLCEVPNKTGNYQNREVKGFTTAENERKHKIKRPLKQEGR